MNVRKTKYMIQKLLLRRTFSTIDPTYFLLPDQRFIEIRGQDAKKLVQGLCTNDVMQLRRRGDCISTVFLSAKGRIIADALLYDTSDSHGDQGVLIETHMTVMKDLQKLITIYKLRSKINISHPPMHTVLLKCSTPEESIDRANSLSSKSFLFHQDPRSSELGVRLLYGPQTPHESIIQIFNTLKQGSWQDYEKLRLLNGLAEGQEMRDRIPLEFNFDLLNSISFSKGCYIGQELTARTKYKGLVRKRLVPFSLNKLPVTYKNTIFPQLQPDNYPKMSSSGSSAIPLVGGRVMLYGSSSSISGSGGMGHKKDGDDGEGDGDGESSRRVGEIIHTNRESGLGLMLIRLEVIVPLANYDAEKDNNPLLAEGLNDSKIPIYPFKPNWWPELDPVTGKLVIGSDLDSGGGATAGSGFGKAV
eukprot:gene12518-26374_t